MNECMKRGGSGVFDCALPTGHSEPCVFQPIVEPPARKLVDLDDLWKQHSVAHLRWETKYERVRSCSWCALIDEVRAFRRSGHAIEARTR